MGPWRWIAAESEVELEENLGEANSEGGYSQRLSDVGIVSRSTTAFRAFAQRITAEFVDHSVTLEIGCSFGMCTEVVANAYMSKSSSSNKVKLLAVDTSAEAIAACNKMQLPNTRFERVDVLRQPMVIKELVGDMQRDCPATEAFFPLPKSDGTHLQREQPQSHHEREDSSISTHDGPRLHVLVDIGGNRELSGVTRLVEWVLAKLRPNLVLIKSETVYDGMRQEGKEWSELVAIADMEVSNRRQQEPAPATTPPMTGGGGDTTQPNDKPTSAGATAVLHSSGRRIPHPLKVGMRRSPSTDIPICRYHNYHKAGCCKHTRGLCDLDHSYCHACLQKGHIARECSEGYGLV